MKEKVMKGMKMNKALLPLLLCCFIFPASGKDAGWQWYNEKINPKEKENNLLVPCSPPSGTGYYAETGRTADGNKAGAGTKPFCIPAWIIL
ncbi:hypothetical protein [Escherichia coli]|uniref:hypothetical protein n=1 Tax=Escherichia coli TaxID=562 RepID=UPI003F668514